MPSNGLTDDQVAGELNKMVEFIKKEAEEKAKEIKVKANEEYEIEKANIVRTEIASVDVSYDNRYKQEKLSQQITKSTIANKKRLKVLEAKEQILDDIFSSTEDQLKKVAADKSQYEPLLAGLVEEGINLLKEHKVVVKVREADKDIASSALKTACQQYKDKTGFEVSAELDGSYLDKAIAGGAIIYGDRSKFSVNNTLDERLKLICESSLPRIRLELFGPTASRKFFD